VWVYWSSAVFLFGAEFTQVYARTHGSKRMEGQKPAQFPGQNSRDEKSRAASGV